MNATGCDGCGPVPGLLRDLRTARGLSAARWAWAPAAGEHGHVVVGAHSLTVHVGRGAATVVRTHPGALPVADRSVPALVVGPFLPDLPALDGVLAEFRRVLRPHGLLSLTVPAGPPSGLRGRALRGRVRAAWTHRSVVDHPDWLLTAADFAVMGDDRLDVRATVDEPAAHVERLRLAGLLPSALPDDVRADLVARGPVRDGRVSLRRVVARR